MDPLRRRVEVLRVARVRVVGGDHLREGDAEIEQAEDDERGHRHPVPAEAPPDDAPLRGLEVALLVRREAFGFTRVERRRIDEMTRARPLRHRLHRRSTGHDPLVLERVDARTLSHGIPLMPSPSCHPAHAAAALPRRMRGSRTARRRSETSMPTSVSTATNRRMNPARY